MQGSGSLGLTDEEVRMSQTWVMAKVVVTPWVGEQETWTVVDREQDRPSLNDALRQDAPLVPRMFLAPFVAALVKGEFEAHRVLNTYDVRSTSWAWIELFSHRQWTYDSDAVVSGHRRHAERMLALAEEPGIDGSSRGGHVADAIHAMVQAHDILSGSLLGTAPINRPFLDLGDLYEMLIELRQGIAPADVAKYRPTVDYLIREVEETARANRRLAPRVERLQELLDGATGSSSVFARFDPVPEGS